MKRPVYLKMLSLIFALLLPCSLLLGCSEANPYPPIEEVTLAEEKENGTGAEGGYTYTLYRTYAEITGYTGTATELTLPATIANLPVKSIGDNAFEGNEKITKVILPESLIRICRMAFRNCTALTTVVFNDELRRIEDYAFRASALTELTCPPNLYSIGREAFACTPITTLTMSDSLTKIGEYAFQSCTALTAITLSPRLQEIGSRLFQNCSALTELILPKTVTSIKGYAFSGCTSLTLLVIPETVTSLGEGIFTSCSSLTVSVIAESEAEDWCKRNATPYATLTEEQVLTYYPIEE